MLTRQQVCNRTDQLNYIGRVSLTSTNKTKIVRIEQELFGYTGQTRLACACPQKKELCLLKLYSSVSSVSVSLRGTTLLKYLSDTLFPSLGWGLNGTFLVTPVYPKRGVPLPRRVGVAYRNKVWSECKFSR